MTAWRITSEDGEPIELEGQGAPRTRRIAIARLPVTGAETTAGLERYEVVVEGWRFVFVAEPAERARLRDRARRGGGGPATSARLPVRAQIPGRVVSVAVAPGEAVASGQRLLSIEAMKMENEIRAPHAGTIERVAVQPGDRVELGDELVVIA